jgi:hypothetical protein
MYAVRSITPWRVAVTTHHASQFLATQEQNNRIKLHHRNAMMVHTDCNHGTRHPFSYHDDLGKCNCLRCSQCGMITNFNLPELPASDFTALKVEEVAR